jgi:hypothetical protein
MIDREALAREMLEAWKIDKGLPCEKAADIALRHIGAARAETVTGAYMWGIENGKKVGRAEALEEVAKLCERLAEKASKIEILVPDAIVYDSVVFQIRALMEPPA